MKHANIYTINHDYRVREVRLELFKSHVRSVIAFIVAYYYSLSEKMMAYYEENEKDILILSAATVFGFLVVYLHEVFYY